MLDVESFNNYSRIFLMILADTNESLQKNESLTQINQIEAFISLKASIDGLLIHGVNT